MSCLHLKHLNCFKHIQALELFQTHINYKIGRLSQKAFLDSCCQLPLVCKIDDDILLAEDQERLCDVTYCRFHKG